MKITTRFGASMLSLGVLLGMAATSRATDIADLPLKASVLAKPNVIFGLDDSGSMDWEVLLDTSSGLFWWDGDDGWNSAKGKPASATGSDNNRRSYLFPVGSNDGGQLYGYDSTNGRALPPTSQFAWVRSNKFNPVYYDSKATYKPWSPAYLDGVDLACLPEGQPGCGTVTSAVPRRSETEARCGMGLHRRQLDQQRLPLPPSAGMKVPAGTQVSRTPRSPASAMAAPRGP